MFCIFLNFVYTLRYFCTFKRQNRGWFQSRHIFVLLKTKSRLDFNLATCKLSIQFPPRKSPALVFPPTRDQWWKIRETIILDVRNQDSWTDTYLTHFFQRCSIFCHCWRFSLPFTGSVVLLCFPPVKSIYKIVKVQPIQFAPVWTISWCSLLSGLGILDILPLLSS